MRIYSSANVMKEYLEEAPEGIVAKFLKGISKRLPIVLEIEMPKRLYLKGELIVNSISEEIEKSFSQSDLVDLLTKELLNYYSLNNNPIKLYREFKRINTSFIVTRYNMSGKDNLKVLKVTLSKQQIFELEMLLADIEEVEGETDFTVEKILQLQYMNFMSDLLQGTNEDAVEKIISELN